MVPSLPEELLVSIFDYLTLPEHVPSDEDLEATDTEDEPPGVDSDNRQEFHERLATLRKICLVSKAFHRLAWPALYRTFNDDLHSLSLFLRTVCMKPEYGLALRSLHSAGWTATGAMNPDELLEMLQNDATLTALFQWRARGFWLGEEEDYEENPAPSGALKLFLLRSLNLGTQDGHMVLLLLLCPNVKVVDLAPPLDFGDCVVTRFFVTMLSHDFSSRQLPALSVLNGDFEQEESDFILAQMFGAQWPSQALQKPRVFQHLQTLSIRYPGLPDMGPAFFMKQMVLPSLNELNFYGLRRGSSDVDLGYLQKPFHCINVQKLTLSGCELETCEVAAMIRRCPKLRNLAIIWANFAETTTVQEPWILQYGEIGEAIAKHAPLLESLVLDAKNGWDNFHATPRHPYILGHTLANLSHLTQLTVDQRAVWGSEWGQIGFTLTGTLPKSIKRLEIISPDQKDNPESNHPLSAFHKWQDQDVVKLWQVKDQSFPELCDVQYLGRSMKHGRGELLKLGIWMGT